jgi:hypothetical protein
VKPPALAPFPALAEDDVFDPARAKGGKGSSDAGGDDLTAMGAISSGRGTEVLIKAAGSSARFLRSGESIAGWKVVGIGSGAVWVQKGELKRRLVFGASQDSGAPAPAPAVPKPEDAAE